MEVNKDEALRCITIAKKHLSNGNKAGALKFAKKSIELYPTTQGKTLLEEIQATESSSTGKTTGAQHHHSQAQSKTSHSSTSSSSSTTPSAEKKYTPEQVKACKTILSCGTDYYKVLSLDKNCTEVEIKKSYRKLALQFHPDKNSAPGADEAFKLISKAFTVLSDPQKRAIHDSSGGDPEMRSTSNSYQQQQQFYRGNEMSPDELFDMFFGGGGLRQPTYRRHNAQFRHPFFNVRQQQNQRFYQQQERQAAANTPLWWLQVLPVLVLFLYAILSNLFTTETPPLYKFQPSNDFSQARTTTNLNIPYYVNPSTFQPIAETGGYKLNRVERQVEQEYVNNVNSRCQNEKRSRSYRLSQARGSLFGIGYDEVKYKKALKMPMKNCDEMRRLGFDPDYIY